MRRNVSDDMGNLRVAMVTGRSFPFLGGVETHVEEVASRLALKGIDVTVLSTDTTGSLPTEEQRNGYLVRRFQARPKSKDYYFSPGLLHAIDREKYDLVHIQGVHALNSPLALFMAQRRKLPTLLTFHTGGSSSKMRNTLRGLQWRIERPILLRATKLIAVCEFEIDLFARVLHVPRQSIALVRNGSGGFPPNAQSPEQSGAPLVLSIGRLERYKGHHRVVNAMPALLQQSPLAHLVIVGVGPNEPALRNQVSALGIETSVSFTSFSANDRDRMGSLVRAADVVVLLSEYEAHPIAVMEALSEGADVVVAATSGMQELGRSGLVRTVELHAAPQVVADEILAAANERRWSNNRAELPSWDMCTDKLLDVYREVTSCAS